MDGQRTYLPGCHFFSMAAQLIASALLLALAGCSTAPIADFLDLVSPGRFPTNAKDPHGGVCIQQGGPAGGVLGGPPPGSVAIPAVPLTPGGPGELPPPLPPPNAMPGIPK
jgi:hypothetical protein